MALRLADRWVWDFWLARDAADYHIFYLQAPRSLQDPELRHVNATIGHSVSRNLVTWEPLPDALLPGPPGSWDDLACWTGSIVRHDGRWCLFYTGVGRVLGRAFQRIGLATSPDLLTWDKHGRNPVMAADARWYEQLDGGSWHEEAWRDPWVFRGPDRSFHALITARAREGPPDGRGVIAHARSDDLVRWEVGPPVSEPGDFGHLEVPQLASIRGRHYLTFSADIGVHSKARMERGGAGRTTGIYYRVANRPLGPFTSRFERVLLGDERGSYYTGKLVEAPDGELVFIACIARAEDGSFVGELSDPLPVFVERSGELRVEGASPGSSRADRRR